jgi:glycosyltransferase involved in cell wall biosynthesis
MSYRVLATCGRFEPGFRGGGPVRSVARIVDTVPRDIDLALVTSDRDVGSAVPYPLLSGRWTSRGRSRVFYLNTRRPAQWLRLFRELRAAPFDLLYVNSLLAPTFTVLPILAARLRLIRVGQVLVAPRGELSPGALSLKARKKRLFLRRWGRVLKTMDVVWHATAECEAADIRAVFDWARVEVNRNQTALPAEPIQPRGLPDAPARFVFIGRVSAKKNLDLALTAVGRLSVPAEFDIYGPLEDATYWQRCQSVLRHLPATVTVRYLGELAPANVRDTFAGYDAFVFPTRGENFGHAIAESLSASCPVICSDRTPWTEVLRDGGGVVVGDLTAEGFGAELDRIAAMNPADRLATRRAAGAAYRRWWANHHAPNILERARIASWAARPMTGGAAAR